MKKPLFRPARRVSSIQRTLTASSFAALLAVGTTARAGNTWTGGGTSNNWSDNANWGGAQPNFGTIMFAGSARTTNITDQSYSMNQINWNGSSAWVMNSANSAVLNLFDNGGAQAKIESLGTGGVTINAPITFAATAGNNWGEINSVSSSITFGSSSTLTVSGSAVNGIRMFGGSGSTATAFNGTVNASGKYFSTNSTNQTINIGGTFTAGNFDLINTGTLNLNAGGSLSVSTLRLGGDNGDSGSLNTTLGASFQLTSATGGQMFASIINTFAGNTSGALIIGSLNTSGINTISSSIFLDSDLKTQVSLGGTLLFQGGSFDIKTRTLTVQGAGATTINETLSSSSAAGGSLVKNGGGTVILQTTNNTYTGTDSNQLNANGTQITQGTLGIYGDGSLGLVPNSAYNNIQFTGNGTLQDTSSSITLDAKRNISVASGVTATFDDNGNVFTINGVINGSGAVTKTGNGTVIFTNTASSYSGITTISTGTLSVQKLANGGTNSSIGNSSNAASNLVLNGATLKYVGSGDSTDRLFQLGTGTNTLDASGAGALSFTNSGAITFGGTSARTLILTGTSTNANVLSPVLSDPSAGNLTLNKTGVGTWILAGTNTYSGGTNFSAGTLLVNGTNSGTGTVAVNNSGSLLGGTGSIAGAVTVNAGANITGAANGTVGTLTLQSGLAFVGTSSNSLASYLVDLSGATSDKLVITGGLNLSNVFDRIAFNGSANGTSTYVVATYGSLSGTFNNVSGLPAGYALSYGATELDLVPVPEPGTVAAGLLTLGTLGWSQRRRLRTVWSGRGRFAPAA